MIKTMTTVKLNSKVTFIQQTTENLWQTWNCYTTMSAKQ